jgi:hypothetical protein
LGIVTWKRESGTRSRSKTGRKHRRNNKDMPEAERRQSRFAHGPVAPAMASSLRTSCGPAMRPYQWVRRVCLSPQATTTAKIVKNATTAASISMVSVGMSKALLSNNRKQDATVADDRL